MKSQCRPPLFVLLKLTIDENDINLMTVTCLAKIVAFNKL